MQGMASHHGSPPPSASFDPFNLNAPHDQWKAFREEQPVFFHEETGYWVVSRYDDCKAIFDDWKTFSSENAQAPMRAMCDEGKAIMKEGGFTAYSGLTARVPPDHTRIRKVAQSCFGPRRFKTIEPQIETIVARHIDNLEARAKSDGFPVDFWREVAYPVPALVLFTLVGVPDEDVPKIKMYGESRQALTWGSLTDEEQIPHAHNMVAYWKYCRALVAARKTRPGDDFPSDLARLQAEGAEITDDEIAGVMYSVLFAGHETTSSFMGNSLMTLMNNRASWDAITADKALIPGMMEELVRYCPSVVGWRRKARTEAVIGGTKVPAGANVLMLTGSANRDDGHFPDGETFDHTRGNARTHLSFGYGIHYCLGFQLAKMEGAIVHRQLSERFPSLRLAKGFVPEFHRSVGFRVPKSVPVEWDI
jgi:cytochrome P450